VDIHVHTMYSRRFGALSWPPRRMDAPVARGGVEPAREDAAADELRCRSRQAASMLTTHRPQVLRDSPRCGLNNRPPDHSAGVRNSKRLRLERTKPKRPKPRFVFRSSRSVRAA
jgi:hypothetical protein